MILSDTHVSGNTTMVIMGCDELGVSVATLLSEQGHIIHVLDHRPEALEMLPTGKVEDGHITPLMTTGSLHHDLSNPSIREPGVFMALSDSDTQNALAGQIAQHTFSIPTVICRIEDPSLQEMYAELNIVAVSAVNLITGMVVDAANT